MSLGQDQTSRLLVELLGELLPTEAKCFVDAFNEAIPATVRLLLNLLRRELKLEYEVLGFLEDTRLF